ncbi:hypothetical protein ACS0TY_016050 [Phlomoides rotata]
MKKLVKKQAKTTKNEAHVHPCTAAAELAVNGFHVVNPQGRKWQLRNISSVKSSIKFFELDGDFSMEVMSNAKEFLEHFNHVNYLDVGNVCFEVLSIMAVNGWQLPQLKLRHLTITSFSEYEHIISGIIFLLESSPNLETLLLEGYETYGG